MLEVTKIVTRRSRDFLGKFLKVFEGEDVEARLELTGLKTKKACFLNYCRKFRITSEKSPFMILLYSSYVALQRHIYSHRAAKHTPGLIYTTTAGTKHMAVSLKQAVLREGLLGRRDNPSPVLQSVSAD